MASSPVFFPMGLLPPPPPPDAPLRSSEAQEKLLYYPPSPPLPHSPRLPVSRRDVILTISALPLSFTALPLLSHARERRGRKAIPPEEYMTSPEGLKYYDLVEGKGPKAEKGLTVQAAPKPPAALYTITEGMKVGGMRTVIIPPELGYGKKGMNEIPPGADFEMNVELLELIPQGGK